MPDRGSLIAIVEDDSSVRKALTRLMRAAGFDVRSFGSAEEFLPVARTGGFACLVLDIKLPGISGFDLYASGVCPPTVFITADERNWERAEALHISCERFLRKPFSDSMLLAAVNGAVAATL
jgi:FixJ family two-component response regulator